MSVVLVVNSGSSSFKYQLIDMNNEAVLASGLVERIGEEAGHARHTVTAADFAADEPAPTFVSATSERDLPIPDHTAGFQVMLDAFAAHGPSLDTNPPVAVGHRVVHGGARFFEPTLVTPLVLINIEDLSVLAPLHNPGAVQGIRAAQDAFPALPHVAVFDTAFHQTLSPAAYTYAIDSDLALSSIDCVATASTAPRTSSSARRQPTTSVGRSQSSRRSCSTSATGHR